VRIQITTAAVGAALLAGCGGGSHPAALTAAAPGAAGATATRPALAVRCGTQPVAAGLPHPAAIEFLRLPGVPDGIGSTADGRASFVALQSGTPRIAVVERSGSTEQPVRTIGVPQYASGVRVSPDGRYVVAAAGRGAVVLGATAAISGTGTAVLGSLAAPASVVGTGPGAAEVAISPDSRYAFVTLEGAGVVAVFNLATRAFIGSIPVGAGALGIATSPDGRWMYEVSESGRATGSQVRGVLNVIDAARAVRNPSSAVAASAPAPCAPVRVAVSPDGSAVWVTARDGNAVLGFDAHALRMNPNHALVSVTRVGPQPLGVAVAPGGRRLLVAASNLSSSRQARAGVDVLDTTSAARPELLGTIPGGTLPDAISAPPAGDAALVTSSDSRQLVLLPLSQLP
jgi:DNA-binding beta-propeller fold protein YncE